MRLEIVRVELGQRRMGRRRDFLLLLLLLLLLLFRVEKRKKEKEKGRTAWNDTPTGLFSSRLLFSPDPRESRRRKKLCSIKASARAYLDTRRTRDAVPWILRLFEGGGKRRCSSLVEETFVCSRHFFLFLLGKKKLLSSFVIGNNNIRNSTIFENLKLEQRMTNISL